MLLQLKSNTKLIHGAIVVSMHRDFKGIVRALSVTEK
jgi:hypothetical protein